MLKLTTILAASGALMAFAQEEAQQEVQTREEIFLCNPLKGLLLVDQASKVRQGHFDDVLGILFDGVEPSGDLTEELSSFLSDRPLTAEGAKELQNAIASYYAAQGLPYYTVHLPEQDFSGGVAQFVLEKNKLGAVHVKEEKYTDPEALKQSIRLSYNESIDEETLAEDLAWINTNSYRKVQMAYQPGEQSGQTDINLLVADQKNWKVISGADNTGTLPIGTTRWFAGVNLNNFPYTDHTLNVKFTTADHLTEYQSYRADYTAPMPWRHFVKLAGYYSATSPKREPFPRRDRQSFQASGSYEIPTWFHKNPWIDQLTYNIGYEFKGTNTDFFDSSDPTTPASSHLALLGQWVGGILAKRNQGADKISLGLDLVGSPAQMFAYQTDEDYASLREGAKVVYMYSRLALKWDRTLPGDWKLSVQGKGQASPSVLLPPEQFGLGGASTVRGYAERVVNGDSGLCTNIELRAPSFPVAGLWFPRTKDSLTLLVAFVDVGSAWYREKVSDKVPEHQSLVGIGSGLRYSIASYLESRFDVGFPMRSVAGGGEDSYRLHFGANLSY